VGIASVAAYAEEPGAIVGVSPTTRRPAGRATVLLVDDEPHVLDGLKCTLRGEPYEIVVAQSARDALDLLEHMPVDVIVSDEHMPGMRGSEFLTQVAQRHPSIGRLILTGQPDLEAAIRSINESKVTRFLTKPCAPCKIRASIAETLQASTIASACSRLMKVAQEPFGRGGNGPVLNRDQAQSLSPREQEVLAHLVEGKRISQIAKTLFVSQHTVRNHVKAMFRKLNVHSQAELLSKCRPR
jgi:DNA-binding NarL/FixJ family response regulator